MPFGGMLGSTFNFVFEIQMEKLQSGDRFYYLQRLDGLHLFGEMENNSFAAMIMRNTDATHLPSDVFSTPGLILEVDQTKQFNDLDGDGSLESTDPARRRILTPLVIRNNPATPGTDTNYLRYTGGDHVVLGGTEGSDISSPASVTIRFTATAATTGSRATSATTSSMAATATTSSSTAAVTTTSRPARATTWSMPARPRPGHGQ